MKNIATITKCNIFLFTIFSPLSALAYTLMESIGGITTVETTGTSSYFEQLFYFLLGVAAVLAVVKIVMGGMKYIAAAGNPAMITDAKDDIYWAVFGLILALASYLILNTINPNLLNLNFTVNKLTS